MRQAMGLTERSLLGAPGYDTPLGREAAGAAPQGGKTRSGAALLIPRCSPYPCGCARWPKPRCCRSWSHLQWSSAGTAAPPPSPPPPPQRQQPPRQPHSAPPSRALRRAAELIDGGSARLPRGRCGGGRAPAGRWRGRHPLPAALAHGACVGPPRPGFYGDLSSDLVFNHPGLPWDGSRNCCGCVYLKHRFQCLF